jgi:transcriptional regulatory protein LevR
MATMSVVSWAATVCSLLILIDMGSLTGLAVVLILAWIAAVSVPVTVQAVSYWRHVRTARRVLELAQKHARLVKALSE